MAEATKTERQPWDSSIPRVLVVEQKEEYGQLLVTELRSRSIQAKRARTVDLFLDMNCRERVDLVSLEIDAMNLHTLDDIKLLRTHFGEGPGTRIVVFSSFMPSTLPILVEQRGADLCMAKLKEPETMAAILETELRKHLDSINSSQANGRDIEE